MSRYAPSYPRYFKREAVFAIMTDRHYSGLQRRITRRFGLCRTAIDAWKHGIGIKHKEARFLPMEVWWLGPAGHPENVMPTDAVDA